MILQGHLGRAPRPFFGLPERQAWNIPEILFAERPERRSIGQGASRNREVCFPASRALYALIDLSRDTRFEEAEGGGIGRGEERFLRFDFLLGSRSPQPLEERDAADADRLRSREKIPQLCRRPSGTC